MAARILKASKAWFLLPDLSLATDTLQYVLRNLLLLSGLFFTYLAILSIFDAQNGWRPVATGLALLTVATNICCWRRLRPENTLSIRRLEAISAFANLLVYLNSVFYIYLDFTENKMVYLFLMLVVFAVSSITLRQAVISIICSSAAIAYFTTCAAPESAPEYFRILLAAIATAVAILILFRSVMIHQIRTLTLLKKTAESATERALKDPLTGAANRRAIFEKLATLTSGDERFWFGLLDLKGFKGVNDAYGHGVGDRLLCALTARLGAQTQPGLTFGRIGGDEFALIIKRPISADALTRFAESLIAEVSQPFEILDLTIAVRATAGFAEFPSMAHSAEALYENADYALYKAKSSRAGEAVLFNADEAAEQRDNILLERTLREADLDRELHLAYQPQMHLSDGTVRTFEALARWRSPVLGNVPPDRFIRAAERSGQIKTITECLLRKGVATLATWPQQVGLSFNLSAQDVADRDFMLKLLKLIEDAGVSPTRVELEITETAVMTDIDSASRVLTEMSSAGCRIALDDFGAGYSSFQYLRRLPLDKVKIDKSFVREVGNIPASREIVAATLALCARLGLECVLEGVETMDELDILASLRPGIIQGYLFGRPMDADAAAAFISGANRQRGGKSVDGAAAKK